MLPLFRNYINYEKHLTCLFKMLTFTPQTHKHFKTHTMTANFTKSGRPIPSAKNYSAKGQTTFTNKYVDNYFSFLGDCKSMLLNKKPSKIGRKIWNIVLCNGEMSIHKTSGKHLLLIEIYQDTVKYYHITDLKLNPFCATDTVSSLRN